MSSQSKYGVGEILALGPVVPVLIIEKVEDALPLAEALVEGGVRVLEVTLRTEAALAAIETIAAKVPDAVVGAGTVVTPDQVGRVQDAGSQFIVSPGCYPALLDEVLAKGVPFLPGTATPSEVMALQARGLRHVKLFPAEAVGGLKLIKSLASPLPGVTFCPTGGISVKTAPDYLAQPNVACVGGSWLTPADLVAAKDWAGITKLAREASSLRG
ncbi:bifunctional 4-hydroxy-2-oxoglutarate aldolase/2-dehydro-3-deoxy-phosphogluconate aldolase [Nitrospirillum sp. BR 11828]|uniref:bifunctional 4-hydroxy-2-oxoglutarate aldolase/2-dehydro-3-deoxy-phosphogluconate aldolase n=1 Tax=Nitrospirillum sp. BR 11828 TaxID=3104325 RepID=UPI002ACA4C53|nr:bifunctional 4-hydroxy-2-oxoglutarate aldolase/2-dehydro-3-deoxy-phosphogluconate aldolase [Nitrospirillum sp. BR 11828]MDZ5648549.1 bifunctional 4-hydroxy-2-oxoglutarate aldolase/2-dehydro-3-deoxy-phosphogluconate aldolase [Nitrospirillum sp. BR 11828]